MSSASSIGDVADRIRWRSTIPYILFHVAALAGSLVFRPTLRDVALCLGSYAIRMFAVTGVFHRYFAHRSYSTSRAFQFVLALLGTTAVQQGPLWWASAHRHHHRTSDQADDYHSPGQRGFWYAHMGWVFSPRAQRMDWHGIRDFAVYPELRWLNRFFGVPQIAFAVALLAVGGPHALVWGFFVSTVLLWQGTYSVNSLAHIWGGRRFATADSSRNNLALALLTLGEGWHNNHHYYPGSMRQGFYWWQVDVTGYVIRAMALVGLVWDVRKAPASVLATGRQKLRLPAVALA